MPFGIEIADLFTYFRIPRSKFSFCVNPANSDKSMEKVLTANLLFFDATNGYCCFFDLYKEEMFIMERFIIEIINIYDINILYS